MNPLIRSVIEDQIGTFTKENVFNPWLESDDLDIEPANAPGDRRKRLAQHFDCDPQFVLIGEAPGYQGCHFSGVPFTNEALLVDRAVPRVTIEHDRITHRPLPWREPSATIVWGELYKLKLAERVVMWNAYAWHPFNKGEMHSNRTPTKSELSAGIGVLRSVLSLFPHARVIAVGNNAEWSLCQLGIRYDGKVRHPANGGANEFRKQLAALCGRIAA